MSQFVIQITKVPVFGYPFSRSIPNLLVFCMLRQPMKVYQNAIWVIVNIPIDSLVKQSSNARVALIIVVFWIGASFLSVKFNLLTGSKFVGRFSIMIDLKIEDIFSKLIFGLVIHSLRLATYVFNIFDLRRNREPLSILATLLKVQVLIPPIFYFTLLPLQLLLLLWESVLEVWNPNFFHFSYFHKLITKWNSWYIYPLTTFVTQIDSLISNKDTWLSI